MDWAQALTLGAIMFTNVATIIILYCHLDNKTSALINTIHQEMKDFHGRMCAIEERNKK